MRIHKRHLRPAGICGMGVRRAAPQLLELGIDVRRFFREGIPISEIEGVNDAHVQKMIEVAKKENRDG